MQNQVIFRIFFFYIGSSRQVGRLTGKHLVISASGLHRWTLERRLLSVEKDFCVILSQRAVGCRRSQC